MANEVTITSVDVLIPEIWHAKYLKATEANLAAASAVYRLDQDVVAMGDLIHVPIGPTATANDKTAGSDVTYQQAVLTKFDITINKHKEASELIEDNASAKAKYDLMEWYSDADGYAIAKQIDTDVLALVPSFSQTVGTLGTTLTDPLLLRAIRYLDDANAPFTDRRFILAPVVIQGFRQLRSLPAWRGRARRQRLR